jgi:hypothetical protein
VRSEEWGVRRKGEGGKVTSDEWGLGEYYGHIKGAVIMEPYDEVRTHVPDKPVLILKSSTEDGYFQGTLHGGEPISGKLLCLRGLTHDEAIRAHDGDGEVLRDRLVPVAGVLGRYSVVNCELSLLDIERQWASRLDGDTITEVSKVEPVVLGSLFSGLL